MSYLKALEKHLFEPNYQQLVPKGTKSTYQTTVTAADFVVN